LAILVAAGGCAANPFTTGSPEPEILTVYPDGSMKLGNRLIPAEDVVIYPDGYGGERAAIMVRIEPLHPNFYRDTIVVRRVGAEEIETADKPAASEQSAGSGP